MLFRPGFVTKLTAANNFPIVQATNQGSSSGRVTNYATPLPSGITAGDLLLVITAGDAGSSRSWATPSGWTKLLDNAGNNSSEQFNDWVMFYKIASGSEGSTVTITSGDVSRRTTLSYRISGASGNVEITANNTATSTTAEITSLSPSWGAKDTLWIAAGGCNDETATVTAPSGFTNLLTENTGSPKKVFSAQQQLHTATNDPDYFGLSSSTGYTTNLIAIEPD